MSFLRAWLCAGLGLVATTGCSAGMDDATASDSASLNAATCGVDPSSPASPRQLMDAKITNPDEAATRLGCLRVVLRTQHDGRAPFASLYTDITIAVGDAIRAGRFEDNEWAARYLTTFAELYRVAFVAYVDGDHGAVPASWRIAFDAARDERVLAVQHVSLGVNAHVDRDLSHALVLVGIGDHGASRSSRHRDHNLVNDILHENVDNALASLAMTYAPGLGEAPPAVMNLLSETYFRAVAAGRFKAWVDAVALTDTIPLFRPAVEGEIELSSKLIAQAILTPNMDEDLLAKLHALEAGE